LIKSLNFLLNFLSLYCLKRKGERSDFISFNFILFRTQIPKLLWIFEEDVIIASK